MTRTNQQAIAHAAEKLLTVRLNKDGRLNGNALCNIEEAMKNTFKANGMAHNEACVEASKTMKYLRSRTTVVA
ncbi:MAG: hypothetical protein JWL86_630 [Rhizobium sp.]|nr:hypothetical protein [Rhizobium sp.]